MKSGDGFEVQETATEYNLKSIHSAVKYDLVGKVAEAVQLTRKTVSEILSKIRKPVFTRFKTNPENFISEAVRLINEQKATVIIEHLTYDTISESYGPMTPFPKATVLTSLRMLRVSRTSLTPESR